MLDEEIKHKIILNMGYEFGLLTTRETMIVDRVIESMQQENEQLKTQIEKMEGLFNELVIALSTMKNGEKYNVSLLADARKLLEELKE